MTTEIWRDFDPNLDIPFDLKNARQLSPSDFGLELPEPDAVIDVQIDTLSDDDSDINDDDEVDEALGVPDYFTIVSQTVRTSPDGSQVVDVVIDVEDIDGAVNYEVRVSK